MKTADDATSATSGDDRRDMHPDRNCYTLPDGDCVSTSACMHSATSGANGIPGYRETYVYTVWMEDPKQNSIFAYCRTVDRSKAYEVAGLIKGMVTREPVIADFHQSKTNCPWGTDCEGDECPRCKRLPQAGGTVS